MNTIQCMMVWGLGLLTSCISDINNPLAIDNDGDGFTELQGDCDDGRWLFQLQSDPETECMLDADGDGYGDHKHLKMVRWRWQ